MQEQRQACAETGAEAETATATEPGTEPGTEAGAEAEAGTEAARGRGEEGDKPERWTGWRETRREREGGRERERGREREGERGREGERDGGAHQAAVVRVGTGQRRSTRGSETKMTTADSADTCSRPTLVTDTCSRHLRRPRQVRTGASPRGGSSNSVQAHSGVPRTQHSPLRRRSRERVSMPVRG